MRLGSFDQLRRVLLGSEEFKGRYRAMFPEEYPHPSLSMRRDTLVFIHLQKTGGSSLRTMLEKQFPPDRRCPIRDDKLHLLTAAELGHYDFYSGHFDRSCLCVIPRNTIKTLTLLREPRARLISLYRFLRSHPTRDEFASDPVIRLANELRAERFFATREARTHYAISNHYLTALGGSYAWFGRSPAKEELSAALEEAKRQIHALTAFGITERFAESATYIWRTLNWPSPPGMESLYVTDKLSKQDARFQRVPPVSMTSELAAVIADLVAYDDEIYRFAVSEFERRLSVLSDTREAASP